jgi:hypothetical protein
MKRSSFLKSLIGLAAAPSILSEMKLSVGAEATNVGAIHKRYLSAVTLLDARDLSPGLLSMIENENKTQTPCSNQS